MYKIAFLIPRLENQGGINVVIKTLSDYLKSLNHDIHIFAFGESNFNDTSNLHVINSNKKSKQIIIFKEKYNIENSKQKFDLVVSNMLRTNYILYYLGVKEITVMVFHAPKFFNKKNFFSQVKRNFLFKKLYKNKNLVALTQCFKDKFLKNYSVNYNSFNVIYNGFNLDEIKKRANEVLIDLGFDYIISIGRVTKTKNYSYAFYILKELHKMGIYIHLVILGDGEERDSLIKLAFKLDIKDYIHFMGYVKNVFPYIKNAKLLLHTSKRETFGNILVEALALNTKVVATDIDCGPSEILRDDFAKYLIPLSNPKKSAIIVKEALDNYPSIKEEYLNIFDIKETAENYLSYIEKKGEKI